MDTAKDMQGIPRQRYLEAFKDLVKVEKFIGRDQLNVLGDCLNGKEAEYFVVKIKEMAKLISTMPKTYEQDGKGDKAVVHLHYFLGGMDWWITEKDMEEDQLQAFGLVDLGNGPELGCISIVELLENGIELDLYWTLVTLEEVRARIGS